MAYRSLPKFNPEARFVANREFLYNGQKIQPGDLVADIPERRLRQLYGMRHVLMAPAAVAQQKESVGTAKRGKR
jgi:hypothetical protein